MSLSVTSVLHFLNTLYADFAPTKPSQCELAKITTTQEIFSTKSQPQISRTRSQYSITTEQPCSLLTTGSSVTNISSVKQEVKHDCVKVGGALGGVIGLLAVVLLCAILGWVLTWYYSKHNR